MTLPQLLLKAAMQNLNKRSLVTQLDGKDCFVMRLVDVCVYDRASTQGHVHSSSTCFTGLGVMPLVVICVIPLVLTCVRVAAQQPNDMHTQATRISWTSV